MKKICILIIYSDDKYYNKMLEIQQKYLKKFENIVFYFTKMVNNQELDIEIIDNFINIKGEEIFLNILDKTVKSMKYIYNNYEFDYLIRTNISTIVNIKKLEDFLMNAPKENYYGCCWYLNLNWLDNRGGIIDSTYFGTKYAQGTNIIFSKDIVKNICENSELLNYNILDDVAFGIFVNKYNTDAIEISSKYPSSMLFTDNDSNISNEYVFYRNRRDENTPNEDRNNDIKTMLYLVENL